MWHHLYVESKKNDTYELIYKTETDLENRHGYQRRNVERRDELGVWDWHIHTTIFKNR